MQEKDISTELWREYEYTDGYIIKIASPETLFIGPSGSHRVQAESGVVHYIPNDWRVLRWLPEDLDNPILF